MQRVWVSYQIRLVVVLIGGSLSMGPDQAYRIDADTNSAKHSHFSMLQSVISKSAVQGLFAECDYMLPGSWKRGSGNE